MTSGLGIERASGVRDLPIRVYSSQANQLIQIEQCCRGSLIRRPRSQVFGLVRIKWSRFHFKPNAARPQGYDGVPHVGWYLSTAGQALSVSVHAKAHAPSHHTLLIECNQCHRSTHCNQQFITRVCSMPVRADVAVSFNGVEQALAWVRVAFVDVAVLSLAWTALCLRSQLIQVIGAENPHGRPASVVESTAMNCLIVFSITNSRLNGHVVLTKVTVNAELLARI